MERDWIIVFAVKAPVRLDLIIFANDIGMTSGLMTRVGPSIDKCRKAGRYTSPLPDTVNLRMSSEARAPPRLRNASLKVNIFGIWPRISTMASLSEDSPVMSSVVNEHEDLEMREAKEGNW